MGWVKLNENLYAKEPDEDPIMVVDIIQLQQDIQELEDQLTTLIAQRENLDKEIIALETKIAEKRAILEEIEQLE